MSQRRRTDRPNVVVVLADQWRAQATGYAGDPNVRTPNLDRLAGESVHFTGAVAGCPVCSPYRASLMTGQFPLTHGVFLNDVCLSHRAVSLAEAFGRAGYRTAYIGKWHLDGRGRSSYIPPERRQGFDFWKALECTHEYWNSPYYAGDSAEKLTWEGYDAFAQTREAQRFLRGQSGEGPFLLVLSWGPPHDPYHTAPPACRGLYDPDRLLLRANVPEDAAPRALAGYYGHISALDACVGRLRQTLADSRLDENTLLVFTSDHGDMLGSQGQHKKQRPWEESIRVPLLLRWPAGLGPEPRTVEKLIDAPDLMPTLLSLAGVAIPETVEGKDLSAHAAGEPAPADDAALLMCASPFGQFVRRKGGREYRGVRTRRHTYVRDLRGPWLLYDNRADPGQLRNLCGDPDHAAVQADLEAALRRRLDETADEFLPGEEYLRRWGYVTDANGTVPYTE